MSLPPIITKFAGPQPYRMSNVDSNFVSTTYITEFFPNQLSNLAVWLDGTDIAGNGSATSSRLLTTWVNKASNSINCTTPSPYEPYYNNITRAVEFTNSNNNTIINGFELNYTAKDNFETVYMVFSYDNTLTPNSFMNLLYPNSNGGRQIYISDKDNLVTNNLGNGIRLSNGDVSINTITLVNVLINNSNVSHYTNGTYVGIKDNNFIFTSGDKTFLGTDNYIGSNGLNGSIYEVLIYSNVLSDSDRQKIESYLYHKWTNFSLDPSNPYYTIPYSNINNVLHYPNLDINLFQQPYGLTTNLPTLNSNNYPLIQNLIRFPNRLSNVSFS